MTPPWHLGRESYPTTSSIYITSTTAVAQVCFQPAMALKRVREGSENENLEVGATKRRRTTANAGSSSENKRRGRTIN